jgi:hypothetical protein
MDVDQRWGFSCHAATIVVFIKVEEFVRSARPWVPPIPSG